MTGGRDRRHAAVLLALLMVLVWMAVARHAPAANMAVPAPRTLTAEYLTGPLGLGEARPRLAWKLDFPERGAVQTAWRRRPGRRKRA